MNSALAPSDAAAKILANVAAKAANAAAAAKQVRVAKTTASTPLKKMNRAKARSKSTSDDDEVETSLSDELSQSWPTKRQANPQQKQERLILEC